MPLNVIFPTRTNNKAKSVIVCGVISIITSFLVVNNTQAMALDQAALAISHAVEQTSRPVKDLTLDVDRKPEKILNFFQVKPATQILEVFAGPGYYTELLNDIVGDKGRVTVYEHSTWYDYSKSASDKRHQGKRLKNTKTLISDMNTLKLPENKYDTALIILGLHDIYLESEKSLSGDKLNDKHFYKALYNALKPNGVMGIVEHQALAMQQPGQSAGLHRLNSTYIKQVMTQAGFTFEASADILQNENDKHDQPPWAEGLRRKTDRSILRFRKIN